MTVREKRRLRKLFEAYKQSKDTERAKSAYLEYSQFFEILVRKAENFAQLFQLFEYVEPQSEGAHLFLRAVDKRVATSRAGRKFLRAFKTLLPDHTFEHQAVEMLIQKFLAVEYPQLTR